MAKLQVSDKTVIQPEVPNLIHDIILSLCQRKYSSVSNVEVDGIICISFQGSTEQQVIKIHENLHSHPTLSATESEGGIPSHARKSESADKISELDLHLDVENVSEKDNSGQNDEISNHFTEQQNSVDNGESNNFKNDISFLSSLLKTTNDMIGNENDVAEKRKKKIKGGKHDSKDKTSRRKRKHPIHHPVGSPKKAYTDESFTDRTESNDYSNEMINQNMIVVKQEVLDEETNPKIVDVFSANNIHTGMDPLALNCQSDLGIERNNYDEKNDRPDDELLYQALGLRRSESSERQTSQEFWKPNTDDNLDLNIVIKEERIVAGEYSAAYGENNDNIGIRDSGVLASHYNAVEDPDYAPYADDLAQGYSSSSDRADPKRSAPVVKKLTYKKKKDNTSSNTWFETVKKNMNRYQAALLKSVQITKKGAETKGPTVQREFLDGRDCNDLEEGPVLKTPGAREIPERDSSASPNPLAVVKKENDQENKTNVDESKTTEPKLVSKYPALFNQLQKAKGTESQGDGTSQQDSLVNRLPFLSFKDLFAQASPNGSSSGIDMRPSPERLADLLTQPAALGRSQSDQHKAFEVGEGAAGYLKKTWNWKRRAVRPKGPNGEILSHELPQLAESNRSNIPVGIANPKRQKPKSKDDDRDWHPHHADSELLSQVQSGLSTRRSSGRSRRTNFTEYSDSDIEEIEVEEDEPEGEPELVSAFCKFNCGARFESVSDLKVHEETCVGRGFKCDYCGLDFNQQYRWQYHMIKVHGVSVDSGMFR